MKFDPFRQQYRELSPAETEFIANFKHQASILWGLMDQSVVPGERSEKARNIATAKTRNCGDACSKRINNLI